MRPRSQSNSNENHISEHFHPSLGLIFSTGLKLDFSVGSATNAGVAVIKTQEICGILKTRVLLVFSWTAMLSS